jgi:excisionase family DNA binding protein
VSDQLTTAIALEVARVLPGTLDEVAVAALAARLRPYLGPQAPENELLTATEAAARAHVHVETIRRAVRAGELRVGGKVGRSPRIRADAVDEWLGLAATSNEKARPVRRRRQRRFTQRDTDSLHTAFEADA